MMIETQRLEIIPLTKSQLELWVRDVTMLEREFHCSYRGEPLEGFFGEIVRGQLPILEEEPQHYIWHSFWWLIRKNDRVVVGSADFKDVPDRDRQVEIGYGLSHEYEHNGYMTEAVKAMCDWALRQNGVSHVIAETYKDGQASQRVLQRCGFTEVKREETIWWRL